jgi:hypothetical protein
MQAVTDLVLEQHRNKLKQGAVLIDPNDMGTTPRVLFLIDHVVKEAGAADRVISRRMQFVALDPEGNPINGGWAPHLDLIPATPADLKQVEDILKAPWLAQDLESLAIGHASQHLVPEHFEEVRRRRESMVDKTLAAVHERLVARINYWSDRAIKLKEDAQAGKQPIVQYENAKRTVDDLTARLQVRTDELQTMRHVASATPVVIGGALVIPAGLLAQRRGDEGWSEDAEARAYIERIAVEAVMAKERAMGHKVMDVSRDKCGWDVTSIPVAPDGRLLTSRHIEVKGRVKGQSTITVTRNEILYGLNQSDKFILAIVIVDGDKVEGPHYVRKPFDQEPNWATASINLDLDQLLVSAGAA